VVDGVLSLLEVGHRHEAVALACALDNITQHVST
jgi:hypothetical protein